MYSKAQISFVLYVNNTFNFSVVYDVYLVGGCVQDLILKTTNEDFDIITSTEVQEVLSTYILAMLKLFDAQFLLLLKPGVTLEFMSLTQILGY